MPGDGRLDSGDPVGVADVILGHRAGPAIDLDEPGPTHGPDQRGRLGDGEVDGESWNYGVGANYYFDGQNGLRGDWTRRDFEDDAGEADVYSVSYVRRF